LAFLPSSTILSITHELFVARAYALTAESIDSLTYILLAASTTEDQAVETVPASEVGEVFRIGCGEDPSLNVSINELSNGAFDLIRAEKPLSKKEFHPFSNLDKFTPGEVIVEVLMIPGNSSTL
jgi:hypothetical protein